MKHDMTKAREMLAVAAGPLGKGTGCDDIQAIVPLYDAVKAIIDALDPQPEVFSWKDVKPGMCFSYGDGQWFGRYVKSHGGNHWFETDFEKCSESSWNLFAVFERGDVTRAPQFDKVLP